MNLLDLKLRVYSYARDFTSSTFRDGDVVNYINEGIDRMRQVIPQLREMKHLKKIEDELILLPEPYHHLLSVYSAARCFEQDERHFQAGNLMNEFETKMFGLKVDIDAGDIDIIDPDGNVVEMPYQEEYVTNRYFANRWGGYR